MVGTDVNKSVINDELSIGKVLLLVFLPAVLILAVFVAGASFLRESIPVFLSLMFAIIIGLVPFELGVIMAENKKKFGRYGLKVAYKRHEPMPLLKIVAMSFILFCWAGLVFAFVQPRENSLLMHTVFKSIPDFFYSTTYIDQLRTFPKWIIAVTCVLNLIFNGFVGPIVEELYFRGYLMSRVERFGKAAPFIITVLFSLYHLFTPWENITRITAMLPYHYFVWKEKNLYIGMLTHCACNLVGSISLFSLLM